MRSVSHPDTKAPQPVAVAREQLGQRLLIAGGQAPQLVLEFARLVRHNRPHDGITASRRRLYTGEQRISALSLAMQPFSGHPTPWPLAPGDVRLPPLTGRKARKA